MKEGVEIMRQKCTPLLSALENYNNKSTVSFHVPGHKGGQNFDKDNSEYFKEILKIDQTEVSGLDDLHDPEGCIKEAEDLLAEAYGVDKSFFLVNGSTVGNLAMIMATCSEGDRVLVQRNCHKSIINGLSLRGVKPIFLPAIIDNKMQICLGIDIEKAFQIMNRYTYTAVILSNPNYYGHTMDISKIVNTAHEIGIPVLVDEAHGAHLMVSNNFPMSALEYGADIVVQSAHKTLPAMTMGSYLHIKGNLVSAEEVAYYLQMLQSSSPSYPIMASLDVARKYIATMTTDYIEEVLSQIEWFKQELNKIDKLSVIYPENNIQTDPLKVTIALEGLSGYKFQRVLEEVGIYSELADPFHVLLVMPLGLQHNLENIIEKIKRQCSMIHVKQNKKNNIEFPTMISEFPYNYKELKIMKKVLVSFKEAVGKVAAENVIPYPPGIPIVIDGERITEKMLQYIDMLVENKSNFQHGKNINNKQICIYLEDEV